MKSLLHLFAFVVLFVFTACSGPQPKDIAEEAAICMQNKDFEGLVDLMAQNGETDSNDKDLFVSLLDEKVGSTIDQKNGIKSYEIGEEKINKENGTASVRVKFNYGDGSHKEDTLRFSKKDHQWFLVM